VASSVSIYTRVGASRVRAQAQYRLSFGLLIVGAFLFSFLDFVMIIVLFGHLPRLGGWSFAEVAFLYGSSYVTFRLADILMTNMDRLPILIRMGTFDQILTRPLGSLGQVLTGDLDVRHVGGMLQGALVFAYALREMRIDWTPGRVVVLGTMLVSAFAIFCAIWVATNAVAFWTTDAREVANTFTYGGNYLTQYPLHIFGRWLRRIFTFAVPLGFVNYFPSLYLLGRTDPTGAPAFFRFASPLVAAAAVVVAAAVWRTAVRHYRSTGS
jgi:ABC-2 type transport system permease protein